MTDRLLARRLIAMCAAVALAVPLVAQGPVPPKPRSGEGGWFSAWASAHNVGLGVQGLSGGSVRMIVRPTLAGQSLRVKFSNIRGNAPVDFSSAYIGVS